MVVGMIRIAARFQRKSSPRPVSGAEAGFTLLEIAIVMVIVGLIMGMGLISGAQMLDNAKRKTSIDRMAKIEDALVVYVVENGCLPCPADGSVAGAGYGLAQPATCTAACTATAGAEVVPWRSLGLDEILSRDGWDRRITYQVTQALTAANSMVRATSAGTQPGCAGSTYFYPCGQLQVNNAAGTEVTGGADNRAAYVLISHGARGWGGWTATAGQQLDLASGGTDELTNSGGVGPFVQNDIVSIGAATALFDDILRWAAPSYLISRCGAGYCGNPAS